MKVAIYCRLSEEDKNKKFETDDSNSIQNQKSMLIQYVIERDWELYNIYSDDDYTGADRKRPEFNRILKDAENHKFDIILCKTQSRFTRELELVEKYIHGLFPLWGIRFISVVDNADTDNKGNKKSRQINGLVNEWYLEDMSENIKSVLTNRRKNGYHIGSFAPYGYKKDPDKKGHLIIDNEAANVVREIFILFSKGYGKTYIARMLNDKGIPNPTEYKRLQGYKQANKHNSTLWKYFTISNILKNEVYIGNLVQGKYGSVSYKTKKNRPRPQSEWYKVCGVHEPIIERDLWERVQNLINQKNRPFEVGKIGLFAGKVRCINCGYTMRSSKTKKINYLKCPTKHIAKNSCIGSFISVAKLEKIIIDEINKFLSEFLDKDMLESNIHFCNDFEKERNQLISDMKLYQKKIDEYSKYIKQLYIDKIKGIISESDYISFSNEFTLNRERFKNIINEKQKYLDSIEETIKSGINRREIIEKYTNLSYLNREIVETLIDYIYVGKRIKGTKEIPIEIHWNF